MNKRRKSIEEKFRSKVNQGDPSKCWLWKGTSKRSQKGGLVYGYLEVRFGPRSEGKRKCLAAHRLAYELGHGKSAGARQVRHSCHVPLCCNPAHLTVGTHQDNMNDMVDAGRSLSGESNPRAKLTKRNVSRIRTLRKSGFKLREIVEQYPQITVSMVSLICRGKAWR